MRKIRNNFIYIFICLIIFNCSVNKERYTYIPQDSSTLTLQNNKMLLLYLYTEKNINKDILLKTDKGELLYSNKGISKKLSI